MPVFKLNKLVRNNIVQNQIDIGQTPHYRTLSEAELRRERIKKIVEEAHELLRASPEDRIGEYADLQQLIDEQMAADGVTPDQVAAAQSTKNSKKGSFDKGLFVETIVVPDGDPWVSYYRQDPERFPEVE